jgi:hypothetical protein
MKTLLPPLGMIVVGVLLTIVAYSPTARFVVWKINLPNLFSRTRTPPEADDLYLTVVPLILGLFLAGSGVVLFVVYLLK